MQTIPQLHIYIETQYRELLANYRMYVLVLGLLVWVAQLGPIQAKPTEIAEEDSSLTAEIHVNYSRPSDFLLDPPNYRVASSLVLTCVVHGSLGQVSYSWSSSCLDGCFAQGNNTPSVRALILKPADSGSHTCTVIDTIDQDCNRTASASVEMNVVGSGIFDETVQTALPDNGIIVANGTIHFYCWFSATDNDATIQFIDVSGADVTSSQGPFKVTTTSYEDSTVMEIVALSSSLSEQGVYTCRLKEGADLNVGIFRNEFSTAPTVTSLRQDTSDGLFALECISTGSPPTNVVWAKDGVEITIDGTVHKMTQTITDRATSTYKNVLKMEDSVDQLSGEYSCKVSNSFGVSNSVNVTAKIMQTTGYEEVLIVGLTVHIFCTTTLKNHEKIQWLLGGFEYALESSTTQEVVLPLELESTGLDGAMFTCRITGLDGAVYDETITLKVKDFENIVTIEAPEMPLMAGNTYSISCVVRTDVQGTVEWVDSIGTSVSSSSTLSVHDPLTIGNITTLNLHFNPLHTSHGDQYTCISKVDILQSVKSASEDVIVQIPIPAITVSRTPEITPIYTTSLLKLTCDADVDKAVDTPVEISSMWTGPEGVFSDGNSTEVTVTTALRKRLVATLRSLESSDSGLYVCEASVNPVSTSAYIVASNETSSQPLTIVVALNVSIRVNYIPPVDESIQPYNYRAGTTVTLYCEVAGASGSVSYKWTSTCSGCFVSGTHSSVMRNFLRSTDAGMHTCTVTDSIGNSGSTTIPMNITGAGIYVLTGTHTGAIPNNSLVIARTSSESLQFYCVSNSTTNSVGNIIGNRGSDITWTSNDAFVITHYNPGGLQILSPYSYQRSYSCGWYGRSTCYETRYERLTSRNQGIYTCKIPDARGFLLDINFGIYIHSFNSPPRVTHLRHVTSSNLFTVECTSTGSPATIVTWAKDGTNLSIDGSQYQATQRVTSRTGSTYLNILHINDEPANIVGIYKCHVSNILGASSQEISVKGIQIIGYEETFEVGETADVTCSSDLDVLNIKWYLDEDSTSTTLVTSYTSVNELKFRPVTASVNDAQYTCQVTSPYGVQSKTVILHAEIPPVWASVNITPIIGAIDGEDYYLTCTVTVIDGLMADAVSVTWLGPDGSVVDGENTTTSVFLSNSSTVLSSRLTFHPLRSTHGGNYTCKATILVPGLNEPPPITAMAQLVVTSVAAFQLKFGPVEYCIRWTVHKARHVERFVKAALTSGIRDQCNCTFSVDAISDGEFSCQTTVTEVVYRSKINGTSDTFTAPELMAFVEDWIANEGTFTVDVFRLRIDAACPLRVQSFHQPECSANATASSVAAGVTFVAV